MLEKQKAKKAKKMEKSPSFSLKRHIRENSSGEESQQILSNQKIGGIGASV